jgi:predicted NBD/HSP70 family sugar kinase
LGWRDLPLQELLVSKFNLPVFVENDVKLAALGEWGFGAGRGAHNLVCISVGTGIGAGVIIGDKLYRGRNQAAGEIGYFVPSAEFLGRTYGEYGALERLASGSGMAERARELLRRIGATTEAQELTSEDVFLAARRGEAWARQVVRETVDYLSVAVSNVNSVLDPDVIVLGGGIAESADLLLDPILERIRGVTTYLPRLAVSPLGRRAAAMGAIVLVMNETSEYVVIEERS